MKKRIAFAKKYKKWTPEQWKKVMWSEKSTFQLVRMDSKMVRRPSDVSQYDSQNTIKTMKHQDSIMVWGCFSSAKGQEWIVFPPKKSYN